MLSGGPTLIILFRVSEDTAICDSNGGSMPLKLDSLSWFAVRVRPRYEKQVAQSIESKGVETFLPLYIARRRWSDRTQEVHTPLFDGYVFCHIDPASRLPILVTPGVLHFVGIGKTPVPV